ncbi:MAG: M28 family peptidase [Chitinophagaceae bacterium]
MKIQKLFLTLCISICFFACNDDTQDSEPTAEEVTKTPVQAPEFNADNAYSYIEKQVAFGPRVPGTTSQKKCAAWLEKTLRELADTVYIQNAKVTQPISNKKYDAINIIASFNPTLQNRVLLLAHWDSRPWADNDTKNTQSAIDAADDGASGVGVLLEIATQLHHNKPSVGVDILLVDAEDVGKTEWTEQSYCLGTQHWAGNPHTPGYRAQYGICLDMVGSKNARFPLEDFSKAYAGDIQKNIWAVANRIGYSSYFVYEQGGSITDDHVVVNEIARIPCVDIINLKPGGGFGDHWHTHQDNISVIDKQTLKAVGQTVLQVLFETQ